MAPSLTATSPERGSTIAIHDGAAAYDDVEFAGHDLKPFVGWRQCHAGRSSRQVSDNFGDPSWHRLPIVGDRRLLQFLVMMHSVASAAMLHTAAMTRSPLSKLPVRSRNQPIT
jgi:hypothetical protein